MMREYEFELPFPPSVNGYWRAFRGRQIISKKGREYRENVIAELGGHGLYGEGLSERLSVSIALFPPCRRKRDIDNYLKATLDAITHAGFWNDDEQIDRLSIVRGEKVKGGKLVVKVKELENDIQNI